MRLAPNPGGGRRAGRPYMHGTSVLGTIYAPYATICYGTIYPPRWQPLLLLNLLLTHACSEGGAHTAEAHQASGAARAGQTQRCGRCGNIHAGNSATCTAEKNWTYHNMSRRKRTKDQTACCRTMSGDLKAAAARGLPTSLWRRHAAAARAGHETLTGTSRVREHRREVLYTMVCRGEAVSVPSGFVRVFNVAG